MIMPRRGREATANNSNSPKVHYREGILAAVQIKSVLFSAVNFENMAVVSFGGAWRAAQGQCAPSLYSCRHTSSPGRTAGGPRRGFVPQGVTTVEYTPGRPRSKDKRLEIVKGTSPRGLTCRCEDKVNISFSVPLSTHLPSCTSPAAETSRRFRPWRACAMGT